MVGLRAMSNRLRLLLALSGFLAAPVACGASETPNAAPDAATTSHDAAIESGADAASPVDTGAAIDTAPPASDAASSEVSCTLDATSKVDMSALRVTSGPSGPCTYSLPMGFPGECTITKTAACAGTIACAGTASSGQGTFTANGATIAGTIAITYTSSEGGGTLQCGSFAFTSPISG
jgi:hypothetical protein